jgi:hypothetical protein
MMAAIALIAFSLAACRSLPASLLVTFPLSIAAIRTLILFHAGEPHAHPMETRGKVFAGTFFAAVLSELAGIIAFATSCSAVMLTGEITPSGPSRLVAGFVFGAFLGIVAACWAFLAILRSRREDLAHQARHSKGGS